jgi:hypothetical protein
MVIQSGSGSETMDIVPYRRKIIELADTLTVFHTDTFFLGFLLTACHNRLGSAVESDPYSAHRIKMWN